jgi:hypothetical protein
MDSTRHGQFGYDGWGLCWGQKSAELFLEASQPRFSDCLRNLMFGDTKHWDSQRSGSKHCHLGDLEALPSKNNRNFFGHRTNNLGTATRLAKFVARYESGIYASQWKLEDS